MWQAVGGKSQTAEDTDTAEQEAFCFLTKKKCRVIIMTSPQQAVALRAVGVRQRRRQTKIIVLRTRCTAHGRHGEKEAIRRTGGKEMLAGGIPLGRAPDDDFTMNMTENVDRPTR